MKPDEVIAIIRSSDVGIMDTFDLVCTQSPADPDFWFAYPDSDEDGGTSYLVHTPTTRVFEFSSSVPPRQRILRATEQLNAER
jgi:hypothetical protein